jgi:thiol:disulfide interchange protein
MAPLSENFMGSTGPKPPLEKWCYFVGFASLIPFLGVIFAAVSLILGIIKIERKGGWSLLVLSLLGFTLTAGLTAVYYDQIFPSKDQSYAQAQAGNPATSTTGTGTLVWLQPADGLKESLRTGKPILYDFTAEWCHFCKIEKAQVFENPADAAKLSGVFIPVVVMDRRREEGKNPSDVNDLQTRYQIRGFPTLVVQYPGKSDFKQLVGFLGEDKVMAFLNQSKP